MLIILNALLVVALIPVISWLVSKAINMLVKKLDELIEEVKKLSINNKEHEIEIKQLKEKSREHTFELKKHSDDIELIKIQQAKKL